MIANAKQTMRVRAVVAICQDGSYSISGSWLCGDERCAADDAIDISNARTILEDTEHGEPTFCFIEAEIPIPGAMPIFEAEVETT